MTDVLSLIKSAYYSEPTGTAENAWNAALEHIEEALRSQGASGELRQDGWQCAARKQALPEPADCNWPFCDCDPYASKVITAIEEAGFPLGARTPPENEMDPAHLTAELLRLKNRFDTIFNNILCDMKPGWDDSIEGFNKAWDVARDIFQEEIGRSTAAAFPREASGDAS
jgi:hypothetical protein